MAFIESVSAFVSTACGQGPAGLFIDGSEAAVPLRLRVVDACILGDQAVAEVTEKFAWIADEDVSATFKFPLPPRSAVYKLVATVGDRQIESIVKAREEAQQQFDDAVNQGHTAVMAKQEASSQIYTLELGNLEAMQEAIVELSYLRVLDSVGGALEYVHTATWTPPFAGSAGDQQRGADVTLEQNPRFAHKVHYTLTHNVVIKSSRGIRAVESPEQFTSTKSEEDGKVVEQRISVSEEVASPSKDLTLLIELEPLDAGRKQVSTAEGYGQVSVQQCSRPAKEATAQKTVALATFVPRRLDVATPGDKPPPLNVEVVLIVDCSGSMSGSRIDQARESALYFIKDMPVGRGIKFQVVTFGDSYAFWSPGPCKDVTEETMTSACAWASANIHANMGGTEILRVFQAVYATPITPTYTRHIIFLTDGGITGSEEEAVYQLVSKPRQALASKLTSGIQRLKARALGQDVSPPADNGKVVEDTASVPAVLCLGIGHGVHRGLLDGLASRTGGVAQCVVDGESIAKKTSFLRKAALSGRDAVYAPRLVITGATGKPAPFVLPPRLFPDEPLHVLVEMEGELDTACVELHGNRHDDTKFALSIPLKAAPVTEGNAYAVLHAMCTVSSLLDGTSSLHMSADGAALETQPDAQAVKAAIVDVAVKEQLVTRHTAAVGVMVQKDPLDPKQVKKVEVPLAVPHGAIHFQEPAHAFSAFGCAPQVACMMAPGAYGGAPPIQSLACMAAPAPARSRGAGGMFRKLLGASSGEAKKAAKSANYAAAPCFTAPPPPPQMEGLVMASCAMPAHEMECDECEESLKMAVDDVDGFIAAPGGAALPKRAAPAAPAVGKGSPNPSLSTSQVLEQLNLSRNVEGWWRDSDEVLAAVVSQVQGQDAGVHARQAKPAELTADQWMTVLVLAFLRKHCAKEQAVWEGMQDKAMAWLTGAWSQAARPVGFTILAAVKLV